MFCKSIFCFVLFVNLTRVLDVDSLSRSYDEIVTSESHRLNTPQSVNTIPRLKPSETRWINLKRQHLLNNYGFLGVLKRWEINLFVDTIESFFYTFFDFVYFIFRAYVCFFIDMMKIIIIDSFKPPRRN